MNYNNFEESPPSKAHKPTWNRHANPKTGGHTQKNRGAIDLKKKFNDFTVFEPTFKPQVYPKLTGEGPLASAYRHLAPTKAPSTKFVTEVMDPELEEEAIPDFTSKHKSCVVIGNKEAQKEEEFQII